MATESLIVELDARTQKLDAALKSTDKKLDELTKSSKKADGSLDDLTKTAKGVGDVFSKAAAGVTLVATALTTMITFAGKGEQQLQAMSNQAKLATEDFEALAFATKQYGVSAEQIADISKDISDKLGEFSSVGTGAFQDFVDVMGLTQEEGKSLSEQFQELSSDQVIGEMVRMMEDAEIAGSQMTFVMEAMGSDLSLLTPLFEDNAAALNELTTRYSEVNEQIALTDQEAADLKDAATSFDLALSTLGNSAKLIAGTLAPAVKDFFDYMIENVPRVTLAVKHFLESFEEGSEAQIAQRMADISEEMRSLERQAQEFEARGWDNFWQDDQENADKMRARIAALREEYEQLQAQLIELRTGTAAPLEIVITSGTNVDSGSTDAIDIEKEKVADLTEQWQKYNAAREQISRDDLARVRQNERDKEKALSLGLNAAQDINSALLDDNKAVGAGIIVADTAIGVQKALAQGGMYGWGQAAAIALSGVAQLSNLESASRGGGTTVTPSEPAAIESAQAPDSLIATGGDVSSGNNIVIRIESDDTATAEYINGILSTAKVSGAIS